MKLENVSREIDYRVWEKCWNKCRENTTFIVDTTIDIVMEDITDTLMSKIENETSVRL